MSYLSEMRRTQHHTSISDAPFRSFAGGGNFLVINGLYFLSAVPEGMFARLPVCHSERSEESFRQPHDGSSERGSA